MRFSVAFWHTFRGTGADPFGAPTKVWPWEDGTNSLAMAKRRSKEGGTLFLSRLLNRIQDNDSYFCSILNQ